MGLGLFFRSPLRNMLRSGTYTETLILRLMYYFERFVSEVSKVLLPNKVDVVTKEVLVEPSPEQVPEVPEVQAETTEVQNEPKAVDQDVTKEVSISINAALRLCSNKCYSPLIPVNCAELR